MSFELSIAEFETIQARLGLDDDALGERLFRGPNPGGVVAAIRAGRRPVGVVVSFTMRGIYQQQFGALAHATA